MIGEASCDRRTLFILKREGNMEKTFTEMITFQVKPNKLEEFEELVGRLKADQAKQEGCVGIRYFKRFYTFDDKGT